MNNLSLTPVSTVQKDILSKLLACEDIIVEHHNDAQTAMFDVKNRVLVLPKWKDMSGTLYDMLVGHEVGHALFTPTNDSTGRDLREILKDIAGGGKTGLAMGLLNIVEDARIERKMKQKFPGLRRDFVAAYEDLHTNRNFFDAKHKDLSELSIGDRLNLHFKIGDQVKIPFSDEERTWVDRTDNTETFDDVVEIVTDLYAQMKEDQDLVQDPHGEYELGEMDSDEEGGENDTQVGTSESDDDQDGDTDDNTDGGQDSEEESDASDDSADNGDSSEDDTDDGESADSADSENSEAGQEGGDENTGLTTVDSFNDKLKELNDESRYDNKYVELSKFDYREWIVQPEDTYQGLKIDTTSVRCKDTEESLRKALDRKVSKSASLLAKQFDMKKAADEHARTSLAKTGVIDTVKMMNYKFTDDIFLRNAVVTDGKNHGLVVFIDWSGSMSSNMAATIEQLYLLATFCKKANIPFDFYSFSSYTPWRKAWSNESHGQCPINTKVPEGSENIVEPGQGMCLYRLVHSGMKAIDFKSAMGKLAMLHRTYERKVDEAGYAIHTNVVVPNHLSLGGTPLDDCIVLARDVVNEFRRKHKLQIVHGVFLTDGDSHYGCVTDATHLRVDRRTHELNKSQWGSQTPQLLKWFRKETGAKAIGMFLTSDFRTAIRKHPSGYEQQAELKTQFKKENYINAGETEGYTELFILKSDTRVVENSLDDLPDDISFTRLRNAFSKAQTKSIDSRTVLNRLAELIAN